MERRPRGSGGGWIAALAVGAGILGAAWFTLSRPRRRTCLPEARRPPSLLGKSILGADKQMVQSVFGPPRAAGGVPAAPGEGRQAYWEADTWYYALDPRRKVAMAIRFENGVARDVDFVQG